MPTCEYSFPFFRQWRNATPAQRPALFHSSTWEKPLSPWAETSACTEQSFKNHLSKAPGGGGPSHEEVKGGIFAYPSPKALWKASREHSCKKAAPAKALASIEYSAWLPLLIWDTAAILTDYYIFSLFVGSPGTNFKLYNNSIGLYGMHSFVLVISPTPSYFPSNRIALITFHSLAFYITSSSFKSF